MNIKLVLRALSIVAMVTGCMFFASFMAQCYMDIHSHFIFKWLILSGFAFILASFLFFISRGHSHVFFQREIFGIIGFGWILAVLLGTLPFLLLIPKCTFAEAFFESASGFTTTGVSLFYATSIPRSLLFFEFLSQWIGGLGTIIFFAVLIPLLGAKTKSLFSSELSLQSSDVSFLKSSTIIRRVILFYMGLTALLIVTFRLAKLGNLDALCYAFTVISTSGLHTLTGHDTMMQSTFAKAIAGIIMFITASNLFIPHPFLIRGGKARLCNEELQFFLLWGFFCFTSLLFVSIAQSQNVSLTDLLFQTTSTLSTAGFSSITTFSKNNAIALLFALAAIIGGCSGSTAGGIKIFRIILALKSCLHNIKTSFRKNIISATQFNQSLVKSQENTQNNTYILSVLFLIFIFSFLILQQEPLLSSNEALSLITAHFFNYGSSFSTFTTSYFYQELTCFSKFLLGVIMIIGRVEIYAIFVLFFPSFWKKFS